MPRWTGWAGWIAVAGVIACATPTQVEVVISTDVPCESVRGLAVAVGSDARSEGQAPGSASVTPLCDGGALGTLFVKPGDGRGSGLFVKVVLASDAPLDRCLADATQPGCIVARRVLAFESGRTLRLPVPQTATCRARGCANSETCALGTCVDAAADCASGECVLRASPPSISDASADVHAVDAGDAGDAAHDAADTPPGQPLCDLPTGLARCSVAQPFCCRTRRDAGVTSACVADSVCPDPGAGGSWQNLACTTRADCPQSQYCCRQNATASTTRGRCCDDRNSPHFCAPASSASDCFPFQCLASTEYVSTCDAP